MLRAATGLLGSGALLGWASHWPRLSGATLLAALVIGGAVAYVRNHAIDHALDCFDDPEDA